MLAPSRAAQFPCRTGLIGLDTAPRSKALSQMPLQSNLSCPLYFCMVFAACSWTMVYSKMWHCDGSLCAIASDHAHAAVTAHDCGTSRQDLPSLVIHATYWLWESCKQSHDALGSLQASPEKILLGADCTCNDVNLG